MTRPKYPDVHIYMVGADGSVFGILGRCRRAFREARIPQSVWDEFYTKATSGDYEHLLRTVREYVTVYDGKDEGVPTDRGWSDVGDLLERGWTQGDFATYDCRGDNPAYCLLGAICEVFHVNPRTLPGQGIDMHTPEPGSEEARKLEVVNQHVHALAEAIRVKYPEVVQEFIKKRGSEKYMEDNLVVAFNDDERTDLDTVLALVDSLEERSEGDG